VPSRRPSVLSIELTIINYIVVELECQQEVEEREEEVEAVVVVVDVVEGDSLALIVVIRGILLGGLLAMIITHGYL
jgi:hypothetical protein